MEAPETEKQPTSCITNAQEDKADSSALPAPIGSSLYIPIAMIVYLHLTRGKPAFLSFRSSVVLPLDLTDI